MKNLKIIAIHLFTFLVMLSCQSDVSEDLSLNIPDIINMGDQNIIKLDQRLNMLTSDVKLEVYNRWGVQIHISSNGTDVFQLFQSGLEDQERNSLLTYSLTYYLKTKGQTVIKIGTIKSI